MAWTWNRPAKPATSAAMTVAWKDRMVALGWTVPRSGTGTAGAFAASDLIVNGAALTTLPKAHFALRAPDGLFEVSWMYGSATTARIKVTFGGTFSVGAAADHPGATAVATDEIVVLGGGTDAAPTYGTFTAGAGNNENVTIVAEDASPWRFALMTNRDGPAPGIDCFAFYDTVAYADAADTAPQVFFWDGSNVSAATSSRIASPTVGPVGWIGKGLPGGGLVRLPAVTLNDTALAAPGAGADSFYSGNTRLYSIPIVRRAALGAPQGDKGVLSFLFWVGSAKATGTRLEVLTPGDYAVANNVAFPYDNVPFTVDPSAGATDGAEFAETGVGGDGATPTVTIVSPAVGTIPGTISEAKATALVIDVVNASYLAIWVKYGVDDHTSLVYDSTDGEHAPFSVETAAITGGTRYTITDASGGWDSGFDLTVRAVGSGGTVA
jgi:hypothetical protein